MTENIDTVDEAVEDVDEGAEDETATEADTTEDNSQESGTEDEGATDDEEAADEEAEDEEPPTRKPRTNADWVALRRKNKLEKAKKGQGETDDEDDDLGDEDDDLDDVSEEDAKIIDKVVSKRLAPFEQQQQQAELKGEIDQFVSANPDFKPYATRALKWAQHPSWKDVPTKQLMYAAAGDNLMKMGAKRSKIAADKARKTKTGTGNAGTGTTGKSVNDMTDEEFQAELLRVKTGG